MSSSYFCKSCENSWFLVQFATVSLWLMMISLIITDVKNTHLEMQFSISIWDAWENYWGTDWKLLELPIHLKPLTIQKHGECVYVHGHLCILYISEHSPFKAPDLKLCKVFQSRPYPQLCDINSPLLAEACNSPCTLTWAYKPLILNNQNTHTILN